MRILRSKWHRIRTKFLLLAHTNYQDTCRLMDLRNSRSALASDCIRWSKTASTSWSSNLSIWLTGTLSATFWTTRETLYPLLVHMLTCTTTTSAAPSPSLALLGKRYMLTAQTHWIHHRITACSTWTSKRTATLIDLLETGGRVALESQRVDPSASMPRRPLNFGSYFMPSFNRQSA